jgi:hypothetical protein
VVVVVEEDSAVVAWTTVIRLIIDPPVAQNMEAILQNMSNNHVIFILIVFILCNDG